MINKYITTLLWQTLSASSTYAGGIVPKGILGVGKLADSPNGQYHLYLIQWGDVIITNNSGDWIWKAGESTGFAGRIDGDGWKMFVGAGFRIEDRKGCFKYLTKVDSELPPNAEHYTDIILQDDGSLVAYLTNVHWRSGGYGAAAAGETQSIIIAPGTVMQRGAVYTNGNYKLAFQHDGNFVVYNGTTPIFNAETNEKGGVKAQMQYDGNFVIYDSSNKPIWHTQTAKNDNAYMAFQPDGHLLIVKQDVIWARFGHKSTYWTPRKIGTPVQIPGVGTVLSYALPRYINDFDRWFPPGHVW